MVKILKGLFKHLIIQAAMIKGAKKAESWRRKLYAIGKVPGSLVKYSEKKEILVWRGI